MGAAGREMVLGRTWSACGNALLGHYHAVLGQAGDERPGQRLPAGERAVA